MIGPDVIDPQKRIVRYTWQLFPEINQTVDNG